MTPPRSLLLLAMVASLPCLAESQTAPVRRTQEDAAGGPRAITPLHPQTAATRPSGAARAAGSFEIALARFEAALARKDPVAIAEYYAPEYRSETYGVTRGQLPGVFGRFFDSASPLFRVDRSTLRTGTAECSAEVEISSRGRSAIPGAREGEIRSRARSRLTWAPRDGGWMIIRERLREEMVEIGGSEGGPRLTLETPAVAPAGTLIPITGTMQAVPGGTCALTVLCTDQPLDLEAAGSLVPVGTDGTFTTTCRSGSGDRPDRVRATASCFDPATGVAVSMRALVRAVVRPEEAPAPRK